MSIIDAKAFGQFISSSGKSNGRHLACRRMGLVTHKIAKTLPNSGKPAAHWIELYVARDDGWYLADLLSPRLESTLAAMSDSIDRNVWFIE